MTASNSNVIFKVSEGSALHFITADEELRRDETYIKVMETVKKLWDGGVIQRGNGFCMAMSDMIHTLLIKEGIPCDLVECKLTVLSKDPPGLFLIGHENQVADPQRDIDTHVVVVTKTKIPMIIDLSIGNLKPGQVPYIVERVTEGTGNIIADLSILDSNWVFQRKDTFKLPVLHQRSFLDRIKTDNSVSKSINVLKILIILALTISTLNAIRGAYDFYQVYYLDNNWGPNTGQELTDRLERVEKLLVLPQDQRPSKFQELSPSKPE